MVVALPALFFSVAAMAGARPLSDSLPLEAYYRQSGKSFSRWKVERFLRSEESTANLAGRSRGYRLAAAGIGATIWSVNLGVSIYQFTSLFRAIERGEPLVIPLQNLGTPLMIGGEIASFVQARLKTRSDFLIHKAALEHNRQLQLRLFPDSVFSLKLEKMKFGWYRQDRLLLPEQVLYGVLRENEQSRSLSNWSVVFREIASPAQGFGALFLAYAIVGYIAPEGVDPRVRSTQLSAGISCISFGVINGIVSWALRKNAIRKYNAAIAPAADEPGILETTE